MFEEMKIRHLLSLTAIISVIFIILCFFLLLFSGVNQEFFMAAGNLVLYVIIPIIFFRYHFRKHNVSVRQVVYTKGVRRWIPSISGIVIVSIAFSLSAFWFFLYTLNSFFPPLVDFLLEATLMPENKGFLAIEIITIVILAPIVEEFIFRGVILHRLIRKTSVWGGILISSLVFGFLHADFIGAFLFGIITSLLFLRTGNLMIPILMHMINNTIAVVLMYVAPTWPDWLSILEKSDITAKAFPNIIVLIISSIFTGYIVYRLGKGLQINNYNNGRD